MYPRVRTENYVTHLARATYAPTPNTPWRTTATVSAASYFFYDAQQHTVTHTQTQKEQRGVRGRR